MFNHDWCDKKLNHNCPTWLEPDGGGGGLYFAKCSLWKTFFLSNLEHWVYNFFGNFMNKFQPSASVPVSKESVSATSTLVLMEI